MLLLVSCGSAKASSTDCGGWPVAPRTAFLGYFWGGVNAVAFALQLGLCPRLLRRFQEVELLIFTYITASLASVPLLL